MKFKNLIHIILFFTILFLPFIILRNFGPNSQYLLVGILIIIFICPTYPHIKTSKTSGNWTILDLELFDYYTKLQPPRPYRFLKQINIDINHLHPKLLIGFGLGLFVAGISENNQGYILWGLIVLAIYINMFFQTVKSHSSNELRFGIVDEVGEKKAHIIGFSVSIVKTNDGLTYPIILPTNDVKQVLAKYQKIEVAFPFSKSAKKLFALGYRPIK